MLPLEKLTKLDKVDTQWLNSLAPQGARIGAQYKLAQTNDGEFWVQEEHDPKSPGNWPIAGRRAFRVMPFERLFIHCFDDSNYPPFNLIHTQVDPPFKATGYIDVGLSDLLLHLVK